MGAAIEVRGLSKRYGAVEALSGVDLSVEPKEILGLLGPNGAGKTSLISILATSRRPTSGDARVLGHSVLRERTAVRRLVGLVPQDLALYPRLTAAENVRFFGRVYGLRGGGLERRVSELLDAVGLEPRRNDLAATFSGGMKRRLNLAVSLVHAPKVVLLDEPTVGVDPQSREHVFDLVARLRAEGTAIVYATHLMEEAERLATRIAVMDAGRFVALGTLDELRRTVDGGAALRLDALFFRLTGRDLRD